jgi:hypothetical protein
MTRFDKGNDFWRSLRSTAGLPGFSGLPNQVKFWNEVLDSVVDVLQLNDPDLYSDLERAAMDNPEPTRYKMDSKRFTERVSGFFDDYYQIGGVTCVETLVSSSYGWTSVARMMEIAGVLADPGEAGKPPFDEDGHFRLDLFREMDHSEGALVDDPSVIDDINHEIWALQQKARRSLSASLTERRLEGNAAHGGRLGRAIDAFFDVSLGLESDEGDICLSAYLDNWDEPYVVYLLTGHIE